MPVVASTPAAPVGANGSRFAGLMKKTPAATKTMMIAVSVPIIRFCSRLDSSVP